MRVNKLYRFFCLIFTTLILSACLSKSKTTLDISVKYHGKLQSCHELAPNLMFYLSNFKQDKNLAIESGQFSNFSVALIGADCNNNSWQVTLADKVITGQTLNFDIGVPFELNHANPLTAPTPLNISEMFWSWQLGHKFLRFDTDKYSFHLGSTGCKSPSRLRPAKTECQFPNRFTFSITNFNLDKPIVFDLDALLINADTTKSCMSEQQNSNCQVLFSQLRTSLFYQE